MMRIQRKWIIFLGFFILSGCSTQSQPAAAVSSQPTLTEVIENHASMTKTLKSLDSNFTVQILKTGPQGDNYVRIVALKLSESPVIIAISQANMKDEMFKDIIANADVTPIGLKLFAPDSPIKRRDDMQIKQIKLSKIENPVVREYLLSLGYTTSTLIIERYSQFYYQKQTLDLIEYILPSMDRFVSH